MTNETARTLDLAFYYDRFEDVLRDKYEGQDFREGFTTIEQIFKDVRSAQRPLTAEDVLAIFDDRLPFVQDWTKPDHESLAQRMRKFDVAGAVSKLRDRTDPASVQELITQIRTGFGDLDLTSLVLHHVYPKRFAMCSHHLASLLYIINISTVPEFYLRYCEELVEWGKKASLRQLTAVETEYALWTWYRLANYGRNEERKKHRNRFFKDPWVQERRALKIALALKERGRLDLAQSYLAVDANLAATIAWVEFELTVRKMLKAKGISILKQETMMELINKLPAESLPGTRDELRLIWQRYGRGRNQVVHGGLKLDAAEAKAIVADVTEFVAHNS